MQKKTRLTATLRLAAFDLVAVALSVWVGFRLKFGSMREIPPFYVQNQNRYILALFLIFIGMELLLGGAAYLPTFSAADGARLFITVAGATALMLLFDRYLQLGIPIEVLIIQALLLFFFALAIRLSCRLLKLYAAQYQGFAQRGQMQRAIIYGAGEVGRYLLERLISHPEEKLRVVGFVDDDPALRGAKVRRTRVLGTAQELAEVLQSSRATQLVVAVENISRGRLSQLLEVCKAQNCRVRRFGSLEELAENQLDSARINDIRLEDLLRRDSVRLNQSMVRGFLAGRCVMITGGAGSIGSELCRQVLGMGARLLVIFDIHENGMYELNNELCAQFDPARYRLCVGSVRDRARLDEVIAEFRPELLFHAAAHKHVPMMELNPREAVKNNVFGTLRTASAAAAGGVERFILISTDKAVNPANIMGATKRIAELCVQMLDRQNNTRYAAVRFGNVLGSRGSVVPHFKAQIERGGPVTVTHPDMCRYFMTIPEAVQLVLEAGAMAKGGEIFVLDMGEPVKICDLARDMIRLSGYEPERDIKIVFTGIRPGEKLFEEIRLANEDTDKTPNDKIYINKPVPVDDEALKYQIGVLSSTLTQPQEALFGAVQTLVPTFCHERGGQEGGV